MSSRSPRARGDAGARDRREELLGALHDGELGGLAAWRARRLVERSPEARRELERLRAVGLHVREALGEAPGHPAQAAGPDLWSAIAARLPARPVRDEPARTGIAGHLLRPLWASTAVAAAAAALVLGVFLQGEVAVEVVQWLDAQGGPVMVLERPDDTVIWVLSPDPDEEAGVPSRSPGAWGGGGVAT